MLMLPFALLMYPASRMGDRMPRAALLGMGTLLYGAAITSLALVPKGFLPLSMIVAGVASSFMYGTVLCYAATLVPSESRGRMMALVNMAGALGMLLGPMCGGMLVAAFRGGSDPLSAYRNVFYLAGAVCALWVLLQSRWLVFRLGIEREEYALAGAPTT
jgi:MFS family permease